MKWRCTSSRRSRSTYSTRPYVSGSRPPPNRRRLSRAFFATPGYLPRSRVRNTTIRSDSPSWYVRRINASVVWSGIQGGVWLYYTIDDPERGLLPEILQDRVVFAPFRFHAHLQVDEHFHPEEALEILPRRRADPLDHVAAAANHDGLLRFALHDNGAIQPQNRVRLMRLLEAVDDDRA